MPISILSIITYSIISVAILAQGMSRASHVVCSLVFHPIAPAMALATNLKPWPLVMHLAVTRADYEYFGISQNKVEAKYFGWHKTKGNHITLHEGKKDALLEALTVQCETSLQSLVQDESEWVFLKVAMEPDTFGSMIRLGHLESWNLKKGAWRFWTDIDLSSDEIPHVWESGKSSKVGVDAWALKALCRYTCVDDPAKQCDECGLESEGCKEQYGSTLRKGTHDDKDHVYCPLCWYKFMEERSIGVKGRVAQHELQKKRKLCDEGT